MFCGVQRCDLSQHVKEAWQAQHLFDGLFYRVKMITYTPLFLEALYMFLSADMVYLQIKLWYIIVWEHPGPGAPVRDQ